HRFCDPSFVLVGESDDAPIGDASLFLIGQAGDAPFDHPPFDETFVAYWRQQPPPRPQPLEATCPFPSLGSVGSFDQAAKRDQGSL
ncbi:MAG: hypothetical protein ACR2RV_29420, partial [Verrucomicrobiales bacterium]